MPLVKLPDTQTLAALGKFALHFADLEHWINWGIFEAETMTDSKKRAQMAGKGFSERVDQLQEAFISANASGVVASPLTLPSSSDLNYLRRSRNDLLHGSPWTLMRFDGQNAEGRLIGNTVHLVHNIRSGTPTTLDASVLDEFSGKAVMYAEHIQVQTMNLSIAKKFKGLPHLLVA